MLKLHSEKCNGCGKCLQSCPFGFIQMESDLPVFDEACVLCGICEKECPIGAIEIQQQTKADTNNNNYNGFWVIGEINHDGNLRKVTLELLSEAMKLAADTNKTVTAVILGESLPQSWKKAIAQTGCSHIIQLECRSDGYNFDIYTDAIVQAVNIKKPEVVLFPATVNGRDLAPRVACRLKTGLTADCTALEMNEDGNLVQIRPTYGGSIMASIVSPDHRPQMASVRPNVFEVISKEIPSNIQVEKIPVQPQKHTARVNWIDSTKKETLFMDASEARVIVAGGYGMGSRENFKLIHQLCSYMNAAPGATRKAVDEGWAPLEIQIGQTGHTVAPDIYIACGISGALQHTLGMRKAKKIIAINDDPAAPIFSMCDTAILGDAPQILAELINKIETS